jgi:hypothetical protein
MSLRHFEFIKSRLESHTELWCWRCFRLLEFESGAGRRHLSACLVVTRRWETNGQWWVEHVINLTDTFRCVAGLYRKWRAISISGRAVVDEICGVRRMLLGRAVDHRRSPRTNREQWLLVLLWLTESGQVAHFPNCKNDTWYYARQPRTSLLYPQQGTLCGLSTIADALSNSFAVSPSGNLFRCQKHDKAKV